METLDLINSVIWKLNSTVGGIIVFGIGVSFIYHLINSKEKKNG
jgi:hypothetical protein